MRIGLVQYQSPGQVSGGFIYNQKLVDYCSLHGDEVEVIRLKWQGWLRALAANWSPGLKSRLEGGRYDLLVEDGFACLSLFALNRRLAVRKVGLVHHLSSSEGFSPAVRFLLRFVERRYLRSVDALLLNSAATRTEIGHLLPGLPPTVVARPAGDRFGACVTPAEISARAFEGGPLRILFAGNVIPRKRLHILIDALQTLVQTPWRLIVAGDESSDPAYAAQIRRLAALDPESRTSFAGPLGPDRLPDFYRQSHLVTVPSQYEGFGMAYLEGMGFGLPALAAAAGGAGEFVAPNVNGFLIGDDDDAEGQIAEAIDLLGNDRQRLADMSLAALATFEMSTTWDESMSSARAFLSGLVA